MLVHVQNSTVTNNRQQDIIYFRLDEPTGTPRLGDAEALKRYIRNLIQTGSTRSAII